MKGTTRWGLPGWLACTGAAAAIGAIDVAHADLQVGAEAGAGYSDNIRRVETDPTDEKIGTLRVDLLWQQQGRLEGEAAVDVSYFEYLDDTFDSEVVGTADLDATLAILPERFEWVVQDSFGQAQTDPFAPITPENRENLNYFTTGPDLIVRLGSMSYARAFGRYSITSFQEDWRPSPFSYSLYPQPVEECPPLLP